jgi:hypothetical protein
MGREFTRKQIISGLAVAALVALTAPAALAGWVFDPVQGWVYVPDGPPYIPAQQQGYREGQFYWETGRLPGHRLSPAELQGFYAG